MKRVFVGPSRKMDGTYETAVNPDLLYLDTCVWIEMFDAYRTKKERIIEEIAGAVGNNEFRLLVSTINFFELIRPKGNVSGNFIPENFSALDYVRQTSLLDPPFVTEQEVVRFFEDGREEVRILDIRNKALNSMAEAFEQRKKGNTEWLLSLREQWDERNERDRVANVNADLYDLSGVIMYSSLAESMRSRDDILSGSAESTKAKRSELTRKKMAYKGRKDVPSEDEEILKHIRYRLDNHLARKYGAAQLSAVASNTGIVFPGSDSIARGLIKSARLTITKARVRMPGLYWQGKIHYYNYFHGSQRKGGQLGDRNHAVYIPYCDYFGTSDPRLVKALKTEFQTIYTKDMLHLFKIAKSYG
jgi:hypothetical protein